LVLAVGVGVGLGSWCWCRSWQLVLVLVLGVGVGVGLGSWCWCWSWELVVVLVLVLAVGVYTIIVIHTAHTAHTEKIILCGGGGNTYKFPHMGKERLLRQGQLPVSIQVYRMSYMPGFSSCNSHKKKKKHMKHNRSCSSISVG
jgi:hypothetical protein